MKRFKDLDLQDMESMVLGFPILLTSVELDNRIVQMIEKRRNDDIDGICIVGMGGSSVAGTYIQSLLKSESPIPILVIRDYQMPSFVDERWVVIVVSYSGNTEETVSALSNALVRDSLVLALTCGGKIGEILQERESHFQILPSGFQPRAAFPILFVIAFEMVLRLLGFDIPDFESISRNIEGSKGSWDKDIIHRMKGKIPLFIAAEHLIPVAYRAKCQFNENAKSLAFYSELPESNHNEIETIIHLKEQGIIPIFLRSKFESSRIEKRIDATISIMQSMSIPLESIAMKSQSKLEESLIMTYFLDYLSVQAAIMANNDPIPVNNISRLKELLRDNS